MTIGQVGRCSASNSVCRASGPPVDAAIKTRSGRRTRPVVLVTGSAARGVMPAALVLNAVNPIMVQGAALADFTMISGFGVDITQVVPDGALVEVDPESDPPCLRVLG